MAGLTNPWPAVAAAVVMFAAVLLRHWRPKLAAGLALVAGLMQLIQWTAFNPVADLGFAPICYQLAVQRDSSARRLGLLLAGLATACVAIVMPLRAPGPLTAADLVATGAALGAMGAVVATRSRTRDDRTRATAGGARPDGRHGMTFGSVGAQSLVGAVNDGFVWGLPGPVLVATVLRAVALVLVTSLPPARRALRITPVQALRVEA